MAQKVLSDIGDNIHDRFFSAMANKEQFTINLWWVHSKLQDYTEFIGLYVMDVIDADSLTFSIKDVLLRITLPVSKCRG